MSRPGKTFCVRLAAITVAVCAALLGMTRSGSATLLYVGDNAGHFGTYDPVTGAYTAIATGGFTYNSLAYNSSGVLYAGDSNGPSDGIYTVNTSTGATTLVANVGLSSGGAGVFASPGSGAPFYYVQSGSGELSTLNPATGTVASVGSLGVTVLGSYDIAFGPTGSLYLSDDGTLYQVNTSTGLAVSVGSIGGDGLELQMITAADGNLYGFGGDAEYIINPTTAAATFVQDTPNSLGIFEAAVADGNVSGVAVPEPATMTVLLGGLVGLIGLRTRRRG